MKIARVTAFIALAFGAIAPVAASTLDEDTRSDVKCLLAVSLLNNSEDPKEQEAGSIAGAFFLGKTLAREPDIDLNEAMFAVAKDMEDSELPTLMDRCGKELEKAGTRMGAAGEFLLSKAQ